MHFLTEKASIEWRDTFASEYIEPLTVSKGGELEYLAFDLPATQQLLWSVRVLSSLFDDSEDRLLLITQSGLWSSRENLHLYYQLRSSFFDHRLLDEAPGHLFLAYERNELQTFTYLAALFGWNVSIFTRCATTHARMTYEGRVFAFAKVGWGIPTLKSALEYGGIKVVDEDCAQVS